MFFFEQVYRYLYFITIRDGIHDVLGVAYITDGIITDYQQQLYLYAEQHFLVERAVQQRLRTQDSARKAFVMSNTHLSQIPVHFLVDDDT